MGLLALGVVYGGITLRGHRRQLLAQIADLVTEVRPSPFSLRQAPAYGFDRILSSGSARRLGVGPFNSVAGSLFRLGLRNHRGFRSSDRSVAVAVCLDQPRFDGSQLLCKIDQLRGGLLSFCVNGREGVGQLGVQPVSLGFGLR